MKEIRGFETSLGAHLYQIPVEAFPGLWSYAYLVESGNGFVLIDSGSGFGDANQELVEGIFAAGNKILGEDFSLIDLSHVIITHGHIDHIGGLGEIVSRSGALVGVHELDRHTLVNYEERRAVLSRKLRKYLSEAGVDDENKENLLGLYQFTKQLFHSINVDFCYEDLGMQLGEFKFLHVPGHCPGHVVIRFHDILFCGDHILSDITPHQSPEELMPFTGLDHYLKSLDAVEKWSYGVRIALCGHKQVITDLTARIAEIRAAHIIRLEQVWDFFSYPQSIFTLAQTLFGSVNGYNALLAIEEAGAHVEYLYQRGNLVIENYDQLDNSDEPMTFLYKRQ